MSPRPIGVGVVDSGINSRDPQVGEVAGGIGIRFRDGRVERDGDWSDLLGHGTAVAATIRGHAPEAALYSIRVFHRRLQAHREALLDAIEWAAEQKLDLVNLSLGVVQPERPERKDDFALACERALAKGVVVVGAEDARGLLSVAADYGLEENEVRSEASRFLASPWARLRGELPREKNFHGTSFAVAHVTGIAAKLMAEDERVTGSSLREALSRLASGP